MLVVRTVGIHNKLQGRSASQVLLLIFFFTPLEGNKQHILLSSSALICCKPSVKPGHDWPNCFLFLESPVKPHRRPLCVIHSQDSVSDFLVSSTKLGHVQICLVRGWPMDEALCI